MSLIGTFETRLGTLKMSAFRVDRNSSAGSENDAIDPQRIGAFSAHHESSDISYRSVFRC